MSQATGPSSTATASAPQTAPLLWAGLIALGFLHSLWSLFLWNELILTRQGGTAFCALGESFQCTALWDGPFASFVHSATLLPVAGWGLVWSVLAAAVPLWMLLRRAEQKETTWGPSALRLVAALGTLAVLGLGMIALRSGIICIGCIVTYVLVLAYAALAWFPLRKDAWQHVPEAMGKMFGVTLAAYLLLLYPGQSTPKSRSQASTEALAQAAQAKTTPAPHADASTPHAPTHNLGSGPATGDAQRDAKLFDLVRTLPPALRQGLADALWQYNQATPRPAMQARIFRGDATAPLRITEWTDIRCGHCAALMKTVEQIAEIAPPGSWRLEPRHFPLDGTCNPHVQRKSPDGVSCTAAKAQICLEKHPKFFDFVHALFDEQQTLSETRIFELASQYIETDKLRSCIKAPTTAAALSADIAYAMEHGLDGTPLVVANGKKGTGFGPFLYALVLTQGQGRHPAFGELPRPNPNAHMH